MIAEWGRAQKTVRRAPGSNTTREADSRYVAEDAGDRLHRLSGAPEIRPTVGMLARAEFGDINRDENADLYRLLVSGDALCRCDGDPDRWFKIADKKDLDLKRRLCDRCPLKRTCVDYAMRHDVDGLWGGTTHAQRKALREGEQIVAEPVRADDFMPSLRGNR